jgi:hypothetical protein
MSGMGAVTSKASGTPMDWRGLSATGLTVLSFGRLERHVDP